MLGIDGGHVGDQTKPIFNEVISFPLKTLSLFFNKAAWLLPRVSKRFLKRRSVIQTPLLF